MTVYYRMCSLASTNPSPIFQEDKFKLNQLCLRLFVKAFKEVKPKMEFILDHCDASYTEMINRIVPFDKEIQITKIGINETMLLSYQIAKESKEEIILFQECDYIYLPNTGTQIEQAIKHFGLVSPYDHPDFYSRFDIHPLETELSIFNNHHFRKSRRNTMTFGMTSEVFKDSFPILYKYGYLDSDVWIELASHGHKLYTPIPSFATHMAANYLAPGIDWQQQYETYL